MVGTGSLDLNGHGYYTGDSDYLDDRGPMKITLSEPEIRIAAWLAKMRASSNRTAGVGDGKIGDQTGEMTDLEGMLGEMAFCKLFNAYPDLSIKPQSHTYDCMINGWRIDVKTTRYDSGMLLAAKGKSAKDCDFYALMIGEGGSYEFIGYASSWILIRPENLIDLGHGPTYGLDQCQLGNPEDTPWGVLSV